MRESAQPASRRRLLVALGVGVAYAAVGVGFAALDELAGPGPDRIWRLGAWVVCGALFAAQLAFELLRLHAPPLRAALHGALAAAMGGVLLAVWVNLHQHWVAAGQRSPSAPAALLLFPVVVGVPAFLVALVACVVVNRFRRWSQ